ncbi:MAG TPA: mechanosensitive ion channel domain-containing protein [Nitrososphaera sp.]|nr:mechanosensitive ion channel domain-containing protein [Nitrososphaera sp.]
MSIEDLVTMLPLLSIFSSLGMSLVFKDYIADLIATIVIRKTKDIKVGNRIKVSNGGTITKGDVMEIGLLRTTVMEVGDGERLPSVRTGRLIKVPNYMLISNPVMIYGDTIIDEVVSYIPRPYPDSQMLEESMKQAIVNNGHGLIEVGLYQKEDRLVIHGVFEVKTSEMCDERSKILKEFLVRSRQIGTELSPAGKDSQAQKPSSQQQHEPLIESKVTLPLQNIEKQD